MYIKAMCVKSPIVLQLFPPSFPSTGRTARDTQWKGWVVGGGRRLLCVY